MPFSEGNGLSTDTFRQLRDLIYEKTGIHFGENKAYLLENRLKRRLEECGCSSYEEYFYLLKYDPRRKEELTHLFNSVTTNETSFFRDAVQISAFYDNVLPLVVEEKKDGGGFRELKVWSAACSTGEEPYTIAMQMVNKKLPRLGWRIDVAGSDISNQALESARMGAYGKNSVRNVPPEYMSRYFSNSGDTYEVVPDIRKLVRFSNINLIDTAATRSMRNMDVIFCRNVLIYFDDKAKKTVVSNLYNCLRPGGYLFIGYSESLHNISRSFKLRHFNRALVYQKEH